MRRVAECGTSGSRAQGGADSRTRGIWDLQTLGFWGGETYVCIVVEVDVHCMYARMYVCTVCSLLGVRPGVVDGGEFGGPGLGRV